MSQTTIRARGKRSAGFALIDPLIGILAIASVMVGALNLWRLAEYKCDKARIEARVSQIVREATDYVIYAPYDLLPADAAQLRTGFLLHPFDPATGVYKTIYPFSVTAAITTTNEGTPAEQKQIILAITYQTNPQPTAADGPQETIHTHVFIRAKT